MAIDAEQVLKQIGALWADLARDSEKSAQALTRACSLTLVVLADAEEAARADVSATLAAVMHTHPSRAIVVRVEAGEGERLEAEVRAQCWLAPGGGKQICSEEILISCSEKTLVDVVSVIDVLRAPDLPAVLWCRSERAFLNPAFGALTAEMPRVIMETERFARPAEALRRISEGAGGYEFTDLSWTRITRWRELVAQSFENVVCGAPGDVTALKVRYMGPESGDVPEAALLLAGWMAHALGWPIEGAEPVGPSAIRAGATRIEFERAGDGGAGSHIDAVELTAQASPVTILLRRIDAQSLLVTVSLEGCPPIEHRVSFPASDEVSVLNEELRVTGRDRLFEQSLRAAMQLEAVAA